MVGAWTTSKSTCATASPGGSFATADTTPSACALGCMSGEKGTVTPPTETCGGGAGLSGRRTCD